MKSLEDLLPTLTDLTDRNKLAWQATRGDIFETTLSDHKIIVWRWSDPQSNIDGFNAELRDSLDNLLDAVEADEFSQKLPRLRSLFESARRSARGVSNVVASLEKELMRLDARK